MRHSHQRLILSAFLIAASTPFSAAHANKIDSNQTSIALTRLSTYSTGLFDQVASEIPAYDKISGHFFVTNSATNKLDVLKLNPLNQPQLVTSINLAAYGGGPNSVAINNGVVAVCVQNTTVTDPGSVVFFNGTTFAHINTLTVGVLPDMLTFTPNGNKLLVANEGQPNDAYTIDPEGSVSIIDMTPGAAALTPAHVTTAVFTGLVAGDIDSSTRIFGPGATIAKDVEPEYIAITPDSSKAYVTLQENNAIAIIDIATASVLDIVGLGFKNHSIISNALDVSDKDGAGGIAKTNITTWPILGMYQPDSINSFIGSDGATYFVTANEGDARAYAGFTEESRVKNLTLDATAYPNGASLKLDANLGRMTVTSKTGDTGADGDIDQIYSFGARSFSIWDSAGKQVFDSGDQLERLVVALNPSKANSSHNSNSSFDTRSDDKGVEPEASTVAVINGKTYAFIGLERDSGIAIYNISNPQAPRFVQYLSNRNFSQTAAAGSGGDLGPEGILFVPAIDSPNGAPMIVVSNEVSGTTTFYRVDEFLFDSDGDEMPNSWEKANGLNPAVADASADADADTLSNYAELAAGLLPKNHDTDGDGVPDGLDATPGTAQPLSLDALFMGSGIKESLGQ
jgi:2',3'-cyclic-nucleotide 2'-phosphodiesterase/3'-nucleotidase/5'-nucleotidase